MWGHTAASEESHCLLILQGHTSVVNSCAFSPDGSLLATTSWDKTTKLWDPRTGACLCTLEGHTGLVLSCAFSPVGRLLVTTDTDGFVKIWNVPSLPLKS